MNIIRRNILLSLAIIMLASSAWAATDNTSNSPTFLWLDICTNANGTEGANEEVIPGMSPDGIDIGVDIGADGTIDRWLSQEKSEYNGGGSYSDDVLRVEGWRRYLFRLDADAGKQAKIRIVDKSTSEYIAVNSIRLNCADGVVVPNLVPNGDFEDSPALSGWTILEGSVTDPASLIDDSGKNVFGTQFFHCDNSSTVVIESDAFTLEPPTSFIMGIAVGGCSEKWNRISGDSYVYIDVGSETEDPNGQYDAGTDVPLIGHNPLAQNGDAVHFAFATFLNTSGLEGKRAQVVAVDNNPDYAVALDAIRMNWDNSIIRNGDFEEGLDVAALEEVWVSGEGGAAPHLPESHPSGGIPGWSVIKTPDGDASFSYFSGIVDGDHCSTWAWVGSGTYFDEDGFASGDDTVATGAELRSDVFVIQPIPDPAQSVFLQFAIAQGIPRFRGPEELGFVGLKVDVNGNNQFEDAEDYTYKVESDGKGWNMMVCKMDRWHYPEYRFYIKPEHQGKQAVIYVEDSTGGSYGWLNVDDFFLWDGEQAYLPFENADFEMGDVDGTIPNWTDEYFNTTLESWLGVTPETYNDGIGINVMLNGRTATVDGNYCGDSAGGDGGQGSLTSIAFTLPGVTSINQWSLY